MEPAGSAEEPGAVKYTVQKTLQANKDHQYALKVYTERLEAELRTIDKLLVRSAFLALMPWALIFLESILLILETRTKNLNSMQADLYLCPTPRG